MSLWSCVALAVVCSLVGACCSAWFTIGWLGEETIDQGVKLAETQDELSEARAIQGAMIQILWKTGYAIEAIEVMTNNGVSEAKVKMLKTGKMTGVVN